MLGEYDCLSSSALAVLCLVRLSRLCKGYLLVVWYVIVTCSGGQYGYAADWRCTMWGREATDVAVWAKMLFMRNDERDVSCLRYRNEATG